MRGRPTFNARPSINIRPSATVNRNNPSRETTLKMGILYNNKAQKLFDKGKYKESMMYKDSAIQILKNYKNDEVYEASKLYKNQSVKTMETKRK